jgi:hypothetical protein
MSKRPRNGLVDLQIDTRGDKNDRIGPRMNEATVHDLKRSYNEIVSKKVTWAADKQHWNSSAVSVTPSLIFFDS